MPTVYRREDAGSPVYAFNMAATNIAHFDCLKAVLKGCLVYGYGSKPAAGWALVSEGAQYLVLANATLSGYLCLTLPSVSAGYAEVWLARTFGGVTNNRMTGDGLKTGLAASNSVQHRINLQFLAYSSSLTTWCCVADGKTFVLSIAGTSLNPAVALGGNLGNKYQMEIHYSRLTLYAGEDSLGNFVVCGGQNTTGTTPYNYFNEVGFTSLFDPATGLLVDSGLLAIEAPTTHTLGYADERTTPLINVDLGSVPWLSGGYCAWLRGLASPFALSRKSPNAMAKSLGNAGELYPVALSTPMGLGDGYAYFIPACSFHCSGFLITDNPGFW